MCVLGGGGGPDYTNALENGGGGEANITLIHSENTKCYPRPNMSGSPVI
jgi:hypothetical protein